MSKKKIIKSAYADTLRVGTTKNGRFPNLVQNESGSVFLVCYINEKYWLVCLSPDIGDTHFGSILQTSRKGLESEYKSMPKGFFIELEQK